MKHYPCFSEKPRGHDTRLVSTPTLPTQPFEYLQVKVVSRSGPRSHGPTYHRSGGDLAEVLVVKGHEADEIDGCVARTSPLRHVFL